VLCNLDHIQIVLPGWSQIQIGPVHSSMSLSPRVDQILVSVLSSTLLHLGRHILQRTEAADALLCEKLMLQLAD
jgi:hypothetical protein